MGTVPGQHCSTATSLADRSDPPGFPVRTALPRHGLRATGLPLLLLVASQAGAAPLGLRIEAGYTHDDNVTRARKGSSDIRADSSYGVNLSKSGNFNLTERVRLTLTGQGGGEKFVAFDGLTRLSYGAIASLQFRPSGDFLAPTWSLFGRWFVDRYESNLRDGYRYAAGLSVRKPVTDRIEVSGALQYNRRDGRSIVFDGEDIAARVNVDYNLFQRHTLYFGAEYRLGDVVSVGLPSVQLVSLSKALVEDDVFTDQARFAYRFKAGTWITTLGYNWPFGPKHSLDLSWRWVLSRPTDTSPYWSSDVSYQANQISLAYLVRF